MVDVESENAEKQCARVREWLLDGFKYDFTIPSDHQGFVVAIPPAGVARHRLFTTLPEGLRGALKTKEPQPVKETLDKLSHEERASALRTCAIAKMFCFKFRVLASAFGSFEALA